MKRWSCITRHCLLGNTELHCKPSPWGCKALNPLNLLQMETEEDDEEAEVIVENAKSGRRWGLPRFKRKDKSKSKADSVATPLGEP